METKKDIGRAFEEHLTNLNESPDDIVWEHLENELKKKKKDRYIIPFWFGSACIGALLIIFVINWNNSSSPNKLQDTTKEGHQKTPIVFENNQDNNSVISKENNTNTANTTNTIEYHKNENVDSFKKSTGKEEKLASTYHNTKKTNNSTTNSINIADKTNNTINNKNIYQSASKQVIVSLNSKLDSIKTPETSKTKESVEEITKTAEKKHETEKDSVSNTKTNNKWSIYPNASLVSYNGFKESFKENISFNYGVLLKYQISEKGSIRLGVSKLELQHSYEVNKIPITQEVNYIEIPLEFNYTLSKNKIQTSIIGGFSYFIITDAHQKTLNENNNVTELNNKHVFNSSSMSLNLGFNFKINAYKRFYFNIEPMFKYQLSPYADSVNFNPYLISISSGIEYKF